MPYASARACRAGSSSGTCSSWQVSPGRLSPPPGQNADPGGPMTALAAAPDVLIIDDPADRAAAARRLATGGIVAHAFANFYVITTRGDAETVRRVNGMKGRPPGQVGSITGPPGALWEAWALDRLPDGLDRRAVRTLVDTFFALGPFGFRGPAAATVPPHLTVPEGGVTTAQVIAPGYACPCNSFL